MDYVKEVTHKEPFAWDANDEQSAAFKLIRGTSKDDARKLEGWMADGRVLTIHSQEGTLEDVFIELAGRALD